MTGSGVPESDVSIDNSVDVINGEGAGGVLLTCEHASNIIPARFENLGLVADALSRHIAFDAGALPLAKTLSNTLDSPLVASTISRLIYDVNRPLESPTAIVETSDGWAIPGNAGLSEEERLSRYQLCYLPFHEVVAKQIQKASDQAPIQAMVMIHSFSPIYDNKERDVEIGILHDEDSRLADILFDVIGDDRSYIVRRNDPYGPADGVTHTLKRHAIEKNIPNVMFEIRNDLLKTKSDQQDMSVWLADLLDASLAKL